MTKNWTVGEAFRALESGDKDVRMDIGRRYPMFATASVEEILSSLDFVSLRKVENVLKGSGEEETVEEE